MRTGVQCVFHYVIRPTVFIKYDSVILATFAHCNRQYTSDNDYFLLIKFTFNNYKHLIPSTFTNVNQITYQGKFKMPLLQFDGQIRGQDAYQVRSSSRVRRHVELLKYGSLPRILEYAVKKN